MNRGCQRGAVLVLVAACAACGLAALDSGLRQGTWQARTTYAGTAAVVLVVATIVRRRRAAGATLEAPALPTTGAAAGSHIGLVPWLAVVAVAATWDVLGLLTPPDRHHLTLSALTLAYQALHAVVFVCWVAIGAVLVAAPLRSRRGGRA
ncbi:MAG: hypothetical protein ACP5P9_02115 [Acidimicrobiales bacterium]